MSGGHVLWDLPVRLFHWSLVLLLPAAWWTAEEGHMTWHQWIGYSVLVLTATRWVWGIVGSRHARFSDFLRGPGAVRAYLGGAPSPTPGHNPLGGWSVLALLVLLLLQPLTGLFNTDDVLFDGPLYHAVPSGVAAVLGEWHEIGFNLLVAMIVLHIVAVVYYQRRLGHDLLGPMLKGRTAGREGEAPPVALWRALLIAAIAAGLLWGAVALAPEPEVYW